MNLQLFAKPNLSLLGGQIVSADTSKKNTTKYDPNSIVDYLKQQGQDSSYSARKELAQELGITNYKGSGEQNTKMLNMLKSGATTNNKTNTGTGSNSGGQNTPKPTPLPNATGTPTPTPLPNATGTPTVTPLINGVDSTVSSAMNSAFAPSAGVTDAQANKDEALNNLNSIPAPSVSADVMQALNTPFNASSAYMEAMNYTNSLLEKLSSGRTSYTDQIKDMMNKIQNRDKFSYDVDTDTLFQQALASAMGSGKQAMQDTMGQASALTGGYASTYAQSAGNQAYNAYIEDAYNNLPEYYQMALEAYNMEGQDMYNQLSMLNNADATEYQRMFDSWNANFSNAQNMYAQEYGAWQDSVNNAYNNANLQLQQQGMAYDQAYNNYNAMAENANNLYTQEYQKWQDMVNNAFAMAGMQNSDYWNQTSMDNSNAQAQLDREHASSEAQLNRDHDSAEAKLNREQNYNMWLAENDLNGDKVVDDKDYAVSKSYSSSNSSNASGNEPKMETLTARELDTFVNIVTSAENEEAGYEAGSEYLANIGKSNTDFASLDFAIEEAKAKKEKADAEAYAKLPVWEKEWKIAEGGDTYNGGFLGLPIFQGADHNDLFTDGKETYTYDQLKDMLKESNLTKEQKKAFLDKLTAQSKN